MKIKDKINSLLKCYWAEILLVVIAVLLFVVGAVSVIVSYFGVLVLGVVLADLGVRFWKKYKKTIESPTKDLYIDVTDTDYDEDVYYVGKESASKIEAKNSAKSMGWYLPAILFGLIGIGLVIIAIYQIILSFVG
ncbi:MAG: hypothetical protein ACI4L7_03125 [Christensenellales bacterium]